MLKEWRTELDSLLVEKQITESQVYRYKEELTNLLEEQEISKGARDIISKAAILTQTQLASHISNIVTKALSVVFPEKDLSFLIEFVQRRNTTEADLWIVENGNRYSVLESRGHGIADVVSLSLRVAYVLLHSNANVVVVDEPSRNVSKNKHRNVLKMLKSLSEELEVQFIIVTHSETFAEGADIVYKIKQNNNKSVVELLDK